MANIIEQAVAGEDLENVGATVSSIDRRQRDAGHNPEKRHQNKESCVVHHRSRLIPLEL